MTNKKTEKFSESYLTLKKSVEELRQCDIENIDNLVPLVEKSTKAYKACKERLQAVENMVNETLGKNQ